MSTVQIIFLVLSITHEILKLVNNKATDKRDVKEKMKTLRDGAREAGIDGNTKKLEEAFRSVGISDTDSVQYDK